MAKAYTISTLSGPTWDGEERSEKERAELIEIMARHSRTRTKTAVFRMAIDALADTPEMAEWIEKIREWR